MFIYTFFAGINIPSFSQNAVFFSLFSYNIKATYQFKDIFIGSWKHLVRMFAYCFDQLYYEGNQEVSFFFCVFFVLFGFVLFCLEKACGHCWWRNWQEVIMQVPEVGLTLSSAFCIHIQSPYHCQCFDIALHWVS
jgi:hypothetical protein